MTDTETKTGTRALIRRRGGAAAGWLNAATLAIACLAAGCAQVSDGIGSITTGSILPAEPAVATPVGTGTASAAATSKPVTVATAPKPERITSNLYRVSAGDRAITDRIERENYTLLRAAETTKIVGGTHFVLVQAGEQSSGDFLALVGSRGPYGAYIRVLEVDPEQGTPVGAISADEIIQFFGPKFGRKAA